MRPTARPPPPERERRPLGKGAARVSQGAGIPRTLKSSPGARAGSAYSTIPGIQRVRHFSPDALADLETASKIVRLARQSDRHLVSFFLEFAAQHMRRTPLDQLLDRYLAEVER
jgi:hypothetical protein